jgi:hypothetical protein
MGGAAMKCPYEISDGPRAFRVWDANAKKHVRGRQYAYSLNAHNAALVMIRWEKVGAALEVYNAHTGKLLGQYVRKPTSIAFINVTGVHP